MKLITGPNPPLHRRFNEQESIEYIRNRYRHFHETISKQVEALQHEGAFLNKCKIYYEKGYKDWVILSAIFNRMMNLKAKELGITLDSEEHLKQFLELRNLIQDAIYPADLFLGEELDTLFEINNFTCLKTYGFDFRQKSITPETRACIERFLRDRMKHFEFDLHHSPLFGETPGNWPET
jgi:hypothetical protein